MKKIIRLSFFTIILIACMLILCSCRSDPKSEQEVLDYAQRKYGSCTLFIPAPPIFLIRNRISG